MLRYIQSPFEYYYEASHKNLKTLIKCRSKHFTDLPDGELTSCRCAKEMCRDRNSQGVSCCRTYNFGGEDTWMKGCSDCRLGASFEAERVACNHQKATVLRIAPDVGEVEVPSSSP